MESLLPSTLMEHVNVAGLGFILVAGMFGALVQGAIGSGAAMITVPAVAVVVPEALPVTVIIWVLPLTLAMTLRERHGVDWAGVGWIACGRLPGSAGGAWIVTAVASRTLAVIAGGAVLVAVAASLLARALPLSRGTRLTAGFVSGVMGTATSIEGPPLALLYQHQRAQVIRATLAASFLLGASLSLLVLGLAGTIESWHLTLAVAMLPGLAAGFGLSYRLNQVLDDRWLRPAVLACGTVTALVAISRGL